MIKNYFKIAWRNLVKGKFISFINLFGLTMGLTCCLLIVAYITVELSYDKFNEQADRIYRINRSFNTANGVDILHLSAVAPPIAPLLKNDFPDIEKMTRLLSSGNTSIKYGDKLINEQNIYFADENLFDFFSVPVIKGNPKTALAEPFSIMMTEETAKKYFGNEDPMEKLLRIDGQFMGKVNGIFKQFPSNAHFHPEILFSFNTLKDTNVYGARRLETNWGNNSFYTYLMFPKNYSVEKISAQLPAFLDKHVPSQNVMNGTKPSSQTKLSLQKLTDIHLYSHKDDEIEANGDIKRVYIFSIIALFILLIACINYMNLSTARSVLRAKEIGIRKAIGAERKEIIWQFLSESILVSWCALIIALFSTWALMPYLNKLSGQKLSMGSLLQWHILVPILLLPFVIGFISGIYPALFMSSFQPVKVLKGILKVGSASVSFRKALVVAQFSISIILIIATVVVFRQLSYMQKASLGYDREQVVNIPYTTALTPQYEAFRNELLQNSSIKNLTRSSRIPTGRLLDAMGTSIAVGDSMQPLSVDLKYLTVDHDFMPTYGIGIKAGRNFSRNFSTDSTNYIINEAAARVLGFKTDADAIGKDIQYGGLKGKIIGICNDFHFESMHQKIIPLLMAMPSPRAGGYNVLSLKLSNNNINSVIQAIENTWYKFLPEAPFTFTFLDERYEQLYEAEQKQGTLFTLFAFIAIFIACLGLFGLSAFSITQRIKEIGIRKVLGASVANIVGLLSKDFLKLVGIAALIAFPVAWYVMHNWLEDFAYRTNIAWWIFVVAGIIASAIAIFTISFHAIKAAVANPVKSLRTE